MRISLFLLLCFTLQISAFSQKYNTDLFTNLFERKNVGNLHLFPVENDEEAYIFAGDTIPVKYQGFLPLEVHKKVVRKKAKAKAVYSIRGNGLNDFYILNISRKDQPAKLVLYRLHKRRLKKIKTLTSFHCNNQDCIQVDTWISDFNGDTRLDLLQKTKHISKGKEKIVTSLFLLNYHGNYQKTNPADIQTNDYQMQDIAKLLPETTSQ